MDFDILKLMKTPNHKLNVRIIALDLDDTLLNHNLEITAKTVEAIKKACKKGIYIVLCSGRAENAILPYVRALDIADREEGRFLIAVNGASIFDLHTGHPIFSDKISYEILEFAYKEAQKRSMPAQVYDASTIYASTDNEWTRKDALMCNLNLEIVKNFTDFLKTGHPKMVIPSEPEKVQELQKYLKEKLTGKADIFISKPYFLEIMGHNVGKGGAVLKLAEYLNIPASETMAFGDSMNDESMILQAQYGIAMSNGLEEIKNKADFVTEKSNNEDGIADFLEKYVL